MTKPIVAGSSLERSHAASVHTNMGGVSAARRQNWRGRRPDASSTAKNTSAVRTAGCNPAPWLPPQPFALDARGCMAALPKRPAAHCSENCSLPTSWSRPMPAGKAFARSMRLMSTPRSATRFGVTEQVTIPERLKRAKSIQTPRNLAAIAASCDFLMLREADQDGEFAE
jgi:hypothetical protein